MAVIPHPAQRLIGNCHCERTNLPTQSQVVVLTRHNARRLSEVHQAIPQIPLVLHGTHGVSDELFRTAITHGMVKINMNRTVRDEYTEFIAKSAGTLELTELKTKGVEVYSRSIERVIIKVLGSAGKA